MGIKTWGDWLTVVSKHGEIDSPGYQNLGRLTHWGIKTWGDWLTGVSKLGEIDSLGYQNMGRSTHWGIKTWGDWLPGVSYCTPGAMFWRTFFLLYSRLNSDCLTKIWKTPWILYQKKILLNCPFKLLSLTLCWHIQGRQQDRSWVLQWAGVQAGVQHQVGIYDLSEYFGKCANISTNLRPFCITI